MSSVYLWIYANNWHWSDTPNMGFWQVLGESAFIGAVSQLTLARVGRGPADLYLARCRKR